MSAAKLNPFSPLNLARSVVNTVQASIHYVGVNVTNPLSGLPEPEVDIAKFAEYPDVRYEAMCPAGVDTDQHLATWIDVCLPNGHPSNIIECEICDD